MAVACARSVVAYGSLVLTVCACADDEPRFGPPSAIRDRIVPGLEGSSDAGREIFPAPLDASSPPAPTENANDTHVAKAGIPLTPTTACLQCHGRDGIAVAKWAYGGYVRGASGNPAAAAEVIVVDPSGAALGPVKASPDGYFWFPEASGTVSAGSRTAVRDKTGAFVAVMVATITNGDCGNSRCHGGAQAPVAVP